MTAAQPAQAPQPAQPTTHHQAATACLNAWLAALAADIQHESNRPNPDTAKMERLIAERSKLFQERTALEANDKAAVARVVADYGAALQSRKLKL